MSKQTSPELTGSLGVVTVVAVDAGEINEFLESGDFKHSLSIRYDLKSLGWLEVAEN